MISKNTVTQSPTNITDKKKWVINMSSRELTHIETDLLAKGLNFSIISKTLPNKDIIATIEDAVKDLEKEEAYTILVKVTLTLQSSNLDPSASFALGTRLLKAPNFLRITCPRMNAKL